MDVLALDLDLQLDFTNRVNELRFFHNQIQLGADADERDRMRRPLILLLYAHFEGFTKFALDAYVTSINSEGLKCADASEAVAAATLSPAFKELRNPQPVNALFKGVDPFDSKLMRYAREREFVEKAYSYLDEPANIRADVLDTESNLRPAVMRKLLYRIGLNPYLLDQHAGAIENLVNRRNQIAHGSDLTGVSEVFFLDLRKNVLKVMSGVLRQITEAAMRGDYRRQ